MNATEAADLLENGEAKAVYAGVFILNHHGIIWYSFDCIKWVRTKDELMKREVADD